MGLTYVRTAGLDIAIEITYEGCGASWDWRGGSPGDPPEYTIEVIEREGVSVTLDDLEMSEEALCVLIEEELGL